MTSKQWEQTPNKWPEIKPATPRLAHDTSDAHTIAGVIANNAFEQVSARLGCNRVNAVKRLNGGDTTAWRELKLALARYLAEYLGFFDEDVRAVYVADRRDTSHNELDGAALRPKVHLVVFADPKTAALGSLVSALTQALSLVLAESLEHIDPERFLNLQVVNRTDFENLARYAALMTAPRYYPSRIWQRESSVSRLQDRDETPEHRHLAAIES